jgi:phenylacetate-CoA ligase
VVCGPAPIDALPSLFCYNPLRTYLEVVDPDANGFGELCITMLDDRAVIALPRYATGDLAKLLSTDEIATAAEMAGASKPWLPLVAVQGRIKDRPMGAPSVESLKELIYTDHGVAHELTGAFRLEAYPGKVTRLMLQALTARAAAGSSLCDRVQELATRRGMGAVEIRVVAPGDFPGRPLLDYERKFPYVSSAMPEGETSNTG